MKKRNQLIKREIRKQFRKLYWKLAFMKLHNENRRKRIDDEILKRIEVLEQKAHIQRSEMRFEFDLPKNEVPFVEVQESELIKGKKYIVEDEINSIIEVLIYEKNTPSLVFFDIYGSPRVLQTGNNKFYQYCPTK